MGTAAQITAALATASYTGASNYYGADSLVVATSDMANGSSVSKTVGITLNQVNWSGDTLQEYYLYPSSDANYYTSGPFTAPAQGIDGLNEPGSNNVFQLAVASASITMSHFAFDASFNTASFNGFEIFDYSHSNITGVTIDPSTNMQGLTASDVSFGSNYVEINWQGLSFDTNTVVKLDLTFGADPPPSDPSFQTSAASSLAPVTPSATITAGGNLDISGASNETVIFAGSTGTLTLDQPQTFAGQISGFNGTAPDAAHSDVVDLTGFAYGSTTFSETTSNGNVVLTATDGSNVATLVFANFGGTLDFASDGNSGTLVTDPPVGTSATVEGQIAMPEVWAKGSYAESVTPLGSGYVGAFEVGQTTQGHSGTALDYGFTFENDQIKLAEGQTLNQSYDVTATNAGDPASDVNHVVSISIGGPGNDTFFFHPGMGADTIGDFNPQHDTIELDRFVNIHGLQQLASDVTSNAHDDAVMHLGHHDSITIPGLTLTQLQAHLASLVHLH